MEFTTTNIKGDIFKNIEKLRTLENWKGVFLSDALSPGEQRQQKHLCCIYASAKSRGLDVRFRGNVLFIEGKRFTCADIESLPLGLTMESVKLIKVSDGYAFQSHHAFLSNMYMSVADFLGGPDGLSPPPLTTTSQKKKEKKKGGKKRGKGERGGR